MLNEFLRLGYIEEKCWWKMMITAITCLILKSPYTCDNDDVNTWASKSTCFEPRIKKLLK